jgi:hypothetical protein
MTLLVFSRTACSVSDELKGKLSRLHQRRGTIQVFKGFDDLPGPFEGEFVLTSKVDQTVFGDFLSLVMKLIINATLIVHPLHKDRMSLVLRGKPATVRTA